MIRGRPRAVYPETTPADTVVEYEYDHQGRQTLARVFSGGVPFVLASGYSFTHSTGGALETTSFFNGTLETIDYNDRLQPVRRRVTAGAGVLLDLEYDFEAPFGGSNNGNVRKIRDRFDSSNTMEYDYDFLNRLTGVGGGGEPPQWTLSYLYDRYGNRREAAVSTGSPPNFTPSNFIGSVDARTNRITAAGLLYDGSGNLLSDGQRSYQWDAENRMTSAAAQGTTTTYQYDYRGRRVRKTVPGNPGDDRLYFYEATGEVLWEFPVGAGNDQDLLRVYLNGRLIFENKIPAGARFFHLDHLGTPRIKVDLFTPTVTSRDTYYPFGRQLNAPDLHPRRFTGKERDVENRTSDRPGLDYFGARYCDSWMGRFTSVDPSIASVDLSDPQSWNRYSYVFNRPTALTDPDGRNPAALALVPGPQQPFVAAAVGITALGLGVVAIIENREEIGEFVRTTAAGVGEFASDAADAVGSFFAEETDDPEASKGESGEERPDIKKPSSLRNPDGTPKESFDQEDTIKGAADSGKILRPDSFGKSENISKTDLRRMRGKSSKDILKDQ